MTIVERPSANEWWAELKERGRFVMAVVLSARRCGKTTWFGRLAADPARDVVMWEPRRVAHLAEPEVWEHLLEMLGMPAPLPGDDPREHLSLMLEHRGDVTLVVDDWDLAVERSEGGARVSDACYAVLDAVMDFCLNQPGAGDRSAFLGLVFLTSLPDTDDLSLFAHNARRPAFERISLTVTRCFHNVLFPMLDQVEAEAVLRSRGLSRRDAERVAVACGGWLGLLQDAADVVREHPGSVVEALGKVCDERVPGLLHASVYEWLAKRGTGRIPAEYLETRLAEGDTPAEFALPHEFGEPTRLAPLLRRSLHRTFMFVDTEQLWYTCQRKMRRDPGAFTGEPFEVHLRRSGRHWVQDLCERYDVDGQDVFLIGKQQWRIDATVGSPTPWHSYPVPEELQAKQRRDGTFAKNHTDDTLLMKLVSGHASRHPMAELILVTGDMDTPMLLKEYLGRLRVESPGHVSAALSDLFAGTRRLAEYAMPLPGTW